MENKKVINLYISQPMTGLTINEIMKQRDAAVDRLFNNILKAHDGECDLIDRINVMDENLQLDKDPETTKPLNYLGYDVDLMADIDLCYFVEGWQNSKGCNIEYQICKEYKIPMIFDSGNPIKEFKKYE